MKKPTPKKKAAKRAVTKRAKAPKPTTPAAANPGENLGAVTPAREAVREVVPMIPQPHGGALKRGGTNPGGGRPPDRTRAVFRALLREKLAPRAVEVVGRSKDARLHLEAIDRFAAVGFNEKLRVERIRSEGKAAAAAAALSGSAAQSSAQVHVYGGPTGLERPNNGEVANG